MTGTIVSSEARQRHVTQPFESKKNALKHKVTPQPSEKYQPNPPPVEAPKFTLEDVRKAIPKHCFERSILRSFLHLFTDIAIAATLFYAATFINHPIVPGWAKYLLWPMYWYTQGVVCTGLWVLAHECGHGAFTDYKWVNDAVGLLVHSFLLVPYHSWQISHSNHHKNTCSMEDDEVFVAPTRSEFGDMVNDTPIANFLWVLNMLFVGWPGYLIANFSGPAKYHGKPRSHFNKDAALFTAKQAALVVRSDIGLFVVLGALGWLGTTYGFGNVAFYYLIPYLVVNAHLVLITFLQHTDTYIPHFRSSEFTWLRGALSTVDRSFGPIYDHFLHHIADTHVCHHLFHYMPFYHAQEATEAIKKVIGEYYLKDDSRILTAVMRSWSKCRFVADEGGVVFYQNADALKA